MSKSIKLSEKYGVNPTIQICFWCGAEIGVALMGRIGKKNEDIKAPKYSALDYEPCDKCKENMALGFTIMEATFEPNDVTSVPLQENTYPTSRWIVVKDDAAKQILSVDTTKYHKAFVDTELFGWLTKQDSTVQDTA